MQVHTLTPKETVRELGHLSASYEGWEAQLILFAASIIEDQANIIEDLEEENLKLSDSNDKYEREISDLKDEVLVLETELAETNAALDALVDEVLEEL